MTPDRFASVSALVGEAPAFLEMLEHVSRLAPLPRPALVVGERGTGKELVAARLHYLSPRWDGPFVKLNCAALPDTLLDAELFGHEAGAFTGAQRRHAGRFELADGGTLFLDEIATASLRVQEKILRVVEYGEFERVGGRETLRVDVRVIGATNADLPAMAAAGAFRADLLDRLAFDVVTVPPLRARPEDIPLLAQHFALAMAKELRRPFFPGFTPPALRRLAAHDWPGNVRELRNAAERAVYRMDDPEAPVDEVPLDPFVSPWRPAGAPVPVPCAASASAPAPAAESGGASASAPSTGATTGTSGGFEARVAAFERDLLSDALAAARFNQRRAAEDLGLGYHQFRHLLRKHGIAPRLP
ncbi:MAG TPA: phage shock protein operon transcriptional activator [Azospirillaceae bacterium]|nr:phage shock protein operon transcriptional activator [Azospirillaceae bacterium]